MYHFDMVDDLYNNSRGNCNNLVKIHCRLNCFKCTAVYMKQQYILRQMTMNEMNTVQIAIAFAGVHSKFYQTFWQNLSRSTWPRLKCAGKCSKLRRVGRTAVMSRFLHNDNTPEHWELFFDLNLFTKVVSLVFSVTWDSFSTYSEHFTGKLVQ